MLEDFPSFLQDYGKLLSHFQGEFEPLNSKQKGDYFVNFVQRLIPHSEIANNLNALKKEGYA
jgi:hypothetical protein